MTRIIKRYENRKLYDTEEKRYVSLEDLAELVRQGDEISVVENSTGEDVTAQTLTKIIMEEGRKGERNLPTEFLHDVVRWGGSVVNSGKEQFEKRLDRVVSASLERLGVQRLGEEVAGLKARLEEMESRARPE